jgi:hypothetical protein
MSAVIVRAWDRRWECGGIVTEVDNRNGEQGETSEAE